MLYAFINDTAAWRRATGLSELVNYDQGAMFLDEQMVNYFNVPVKIGDTRKQRLAISVDTSSGESVSGVPDGMMHLMLDKDKLGGVDFNSVTANEYGQLFNIIELCFTSQNRTAAYLNAQMESNSIYGVYMVGSLKISGSYVTLDNYYLQNNLIARPMIRSWIEFRVALAGQVVDFHIWAERDQFRADYPFTTMTAVVYPCEPAQILTLNDMENVAKMLQEGSLTSTAITATEMAADDHSGMYRFKCKYNNSILGIGRYSFYFGVMYKGRAPSREEARQFIKTDLLEKTNTTEDIWIDVLPDLFARASFMLVPIWGNYSRNEANETIKFGVYDAQVFAKALKATYPDYNQSNIDEYAEVLTVASSDILVAAIPGTDNDAANKQLSAIHPTYMGVSNDDPLFSKQSTITQQFSEQLNDTMGTLIAAGSSNVVDADVVYGLRHLSFSVNGVDYHVLIKADYPLSGI